MVNKKNINPSPFSLFGKEKIQQIEKIDVGPPWLTRFERSRIIGARALQLSLGAPILLELEEEIKDPIKIAELEFDEGILPISVRRVLPSGRYQDIALKHLIELSKKYNIFFK